MSESKQAFNMTLEEQMTLVGKWEDAHRVPEQKRLTWFYPDFGSYVLKEYVTAERLAAAAKEARTQNVLAAERRQNRKHNGHER